jgi:hypothetical protein
LLEQELSSLPKGLYNPQAFFTHAASLDQGFPHCPIFPTAASRRSPDRVSVPVWLIVLSDQLRIVALVGRYPANKLIRFGLIHQCQALRSPAFLRRAYAVLARVSPGCPPLMGRFPNIPHPSASRQHVLLHLLPIDLHVLSTPPAFNLSQDQTLHLKSCDFSSEKVPTNFQ